MDFQTALDIALQVHAPGLGIFMLLVSLLGLPEFYLFVIPLILWCYDKTLGLRLIILLSISAAINAMLKILFHAPRPYWVSSEVKAFTSEPSFGMPSAAARSHSHFWGISVQWLKRHVYGPSASRLSSLSVFHGCTLACIILQTFSPAGFLVLSSFSCFCVMKPELQSGFHENRSLSGSFSHYVHHVHSSYCPRWLYSALATGTCLPSGPHWHLRRPMHPSIPCLCRMYLVAAGLLFGAATGAVLSAIYPVWC